VIVWEDTLKCHCAWRPTNVKGDLRLVVIIVCYCLRIVESDLIKCVDCLSAESVSGTFEFEDDIGVLVFLTVLDQGRLLPISSVGSYSGE